MLVDRKQPRWLLGWRRYARSTDERTWLVAALPNLGTGDSISLIHTDMRAQYATVLISCATSLTTDYIVRQKVGGIALSLSYIKQIPFPDFRQFSKEELAFVKSRVLELTYTSHSMRPWAKDLGYIGVPFAFDLDRRTILRAELDAFFARKYGLTRDELRYILDPADTHGPGYPSETFRGLKRNEIERFGEYRTQRLVLEAFDRLTGA